MSTQRQQYSAEFKARVALEALKGLKTVNELASTYGVHPTQIAHWKHHLLVETMFPMRNLRRMHPIGTGEFVDRFEPFEGFQRHTGFELCAVLLPLCRHLSSPPLPLLWTQHSILI